MKNKADPVLVAVIVFSLLGVLGGSGSFAGQIDFPQAVVTKPAVIQSPIVAIGDDEALAHVARHFGAQDGRHVE